MPICPKCGTESSDGSAFCSHCGLPFAEAQACPSCGAKVSSTDKFCPSCGTHLSQPAPAAPPIYQVPPPAPPKKPIWPWLVAAAVCVLCIGPAILGAILFPVFQQAKVAAQATKALSTAKQLNLALQIYASDFDDRFPSFSNEEHLATVLEPFGKFPKLRETVVGYSWNQDLSNQVISYIKDPQNTWVFTSKEADGQRKYIVGIVDGSVRRVLQDSLDQIKQSSKNPIDRAMGGDLSATGNVHKIWKETVDGPDGKTEAQYDFTSPTKYVSIWVIRSKDPDGVLVTSKLRGTGNYSFAEGKLDLQAPTEVNGSVLIGKTTKWVPLPKNDPMLAAFKNQILGKTVLSVENLSDNELQVSGPRGPDFFSVPSQGETLKL